MSDAADAERLSLVAMQHRRYIGRHSARPKASTRTMSAAPIVLEAIVKKRCVTATYNGGTVVLAPHALFQRHESYYVAAATITRDGVKPREEKIGAFKLDGLVDLAPTEQDFFTSSVWNPGDERFAGQVLMAVED
jgi:hypothetical protein